MFKVMARHLFSIEFLTIFNRNSPISILSRPHTRACHFSGRSDFSYIPNNWRFLGFNLYETQLKKCVLKVIGSRIRTACTTLH
jgi:hypothetical protein